MMTTYASGANVCRFVTKWLRVFQDACGVVDDRRAAVASSASVIKRKGNPWFQLRRRPCLQRRSRIICFRRACPNGRVDRGTLSVSCIVRWYPDMSTAAPSFPYERVSAERRAIWHIWICGGAMPGHIAAGDIIARGSHEPSEMARLGTTTGLRKAAGRLEEPTAREDLPPALA